MSGYFMDGKPSPGVPSPPTEFPECDQESQSDEPIEPSGKNYKTIKDNEDSK